MATIVTGIITWRGDAGRPESHLGRSRVRNVTDAAALTTLATALLAHTDCNCASTSLVSSTEVNNVAPGVDANVDQKGIVFFKDSADGSVHRINFPAPVAADYTLQDVGQRYTNTAGTAIIGFINTATGKTFTFLYGIVVGKA